MMNSKSHDSLKLGNIVLINIALQIILYGRIDLNTFLNTKKVESGNDLMKLYIYIYIYTTSLKRFDPYGF